MQLLRGKFQAFILSHIKGCESSLIIIVNELQELQSSELEHYEK